MSYGMHDYLMERARKNNTGMQKRAAEGDGAGKGGIRELLNAGKQRAADLYGRASREAEKYYSRSRAFLAEHPEILYGLGGAGIGAGIGALVSPKRRLLGSLLGLGLGGALGAGGKVLWDKYSQDVVDAVPERFGGRQLRNWFNPASQGMTRREQEAEKEASKNIRQQQ